jgi:ABC-2 type transport system permease protein
VIQTQIALLKRELWEHRAIYVAPIVIGLLMSLMLITGQVAVSTLDQVIDIAILGATNLGENERAAAVTVMMTATSPLFLITMWILTVFYTLDSLYAERKDRSILFWRSLPVTDAETVISKLLTALIVIPLITFALMMITHLVILTISSIWIGIRGADAWHLIWRVAPLFDNWTATLIFVLALPLWLSPFVGWFLFISAYTKRSPFLTAFLPIVILPMLEKIVLGSSIFAQTFFERSIKVPLFKGRDTFEIFSDSGIDRDVLAESGLNLMSLIDLGGYLTSPGLWAGFAVCGLLTAAAIYVRRFRDET